MPRCQIVSADDHTLFRSGVRRLLETCEDLVVTGEAADGLALLDLLKPQVNNAADLVRYAVHNGFVEA